MINSIELSVKIYSFISGNLKLNLKELYKSVLLKCKKTTSKATKSGVTHSGVF